MTVQMHSTSISPAQSISDKQFVIVQTAEYGKRIGTLEFICPSPFHGETVKRAFVISLAGDPFWTEYPLVEELVYVTAPQPETPEFELEDDPDYNQFLHDCEASEIALERAEQAPALPYWATNGQVMVKGANLKKGDTIYFSQKANPRYLKHDMGQGKWEVRTLASSFGFDKRIPGTCIVEAERWYVTKCPQPAFAGVG